MSFKSKKQGDSMIVAVVGKIMGGPDGEKFIEHCTQHLANPEVKRLILNMREVHFINNSGLGTLIAIYVRCQESKRECVVYQVPRRIQQIFAITKVNTILKEIETI